MQFHPEFQLPSERALFFTKLTCDIQKSQYSSGICFLSMYGSCKFNYLMTNKAPKTGSF